MSRGSDTTIATEWIVVIRLTQVLEQILPVELTVVSIDLGDLGSKLVHEALGETAHDIYLSDASHLLSLDHLEDHIDRLLLCIADEATGIDDDDLAIDRVRIVMHYIAVG